MKNPLFYTILTQNIKCMKTNWFLLSHTTQILKEQFLHYLVNSHTSKLHNQRWNTDELKAPNQNQKRPRRGLKGHEGFEIILR